jgi:prepilin-type N-terminal cleavage/methylation domain-containing protein
MNQNSTQQLVPGPVRKYSARWCATAFTLVEILIVISIIAILAALVVGLAGGAAEKKNRARVETELHQIETAIEHYKEKLGYYPPDNTNNVGMQLQPLFYELTGTRLDPANNDYITVTGERISTNVLVDAFARGGFANMSAPGADISAKNFFTTIKPGQHKKIPTAKGLVEVLTVPVELVPGQVNTWRYVSTNPTNNPGSFDLWAEIRIRGKNVLIPNWKH